MCCDWLAYVNAVACCAVVLHYSGYTLSATGHSRHSLINLAARSACFKSKCSETAIVLCSVIEPPVNYQDNLCRIY